MKFVATVVTGIGVMGALFAAEPARVRPDFGVVFNDDADLAFVVPDRAKSEELLRANVGALADTPVKTFVYCVGMGGDLLYYNTRVASRVGWRKAPDETPGSLMEKRMENARVCLAAGADAVRTAGEAAKRLGLRFIPSLRMNDAHFMANPDQHSMTSEFWFKHRAEFTIKDSPLALQPAYGNLLDFTHAAVRQLRLDTVLEVLERNHDLVDGFELDFNRFQVFFPKGRAATGAPLITELVRRVRARLDELALTEKRPMYLFVRVPPGVDDCTTAGLEIERWMNEGLVDLVSPAQIMTLAGDMPIAELVAPGKKEWSTDLSLALSADELAAALSTEHGEAVRRRERLARGDAGGDSRRRRELPGGGCRRLLSIQFLWRVRRDASARRETLPPVPRSRPPRESHRAAGRVCGDEELLSRRSRLLRLRQTTAGETLPRWRVARDARRRRESLRGAVSAHDLRAAARSSRAARRGKDHREAERRHRV